MPRPTEPVEWICYADDITIWASGVKNSELEHMGNGDMTEIYSVLQDNSLLISVPKSTLTLYIQDPMQANTHPKINISDAASPCLQPKVTRSVSGYLLFL